MTLRDKVLASSSVHEFTKDMIREAERHDPVDAIKDLELALEVARERWAILLEAVQTAEDQMTSMRTERKYPII